MSRLTRVYQKLFGGSGASGNFGQFGSLAAGSPNYTKDPSTIQDLAAFDTGWSAETIANNRPALEDFNGLDYLVFYQLCYLLQEGIAEWNSDTTYYEDSIAKYAGILYRSLQDNNINQQPDTETSWWKVVVANKTADGTSIKDTVNVLSVGNVFGSWVDKSSNYGAQQASTDGFVCATLTVANRGNYRLQGYTDVSASPTTIRGYCSAGGYFSGLDNGCTKSSFMMPVKKGDYWKVVGEAGFANEGGQTIAVYFMPLGS